MTVKKTQSEVEANNIGDSDKHVLHRQNNIFMAIFGYRKSADAILDYATQMDEKSEHIKNELTIYEMEEIKLQSINALSEIELIKIHLDKFLDAGMETIDPLFTLKEEILCAQQTGTINPSDGVKDEGVISETSNIPCNQKCNNNVKNIDLIENDKNSFIKLIDKIINYLFTSKQNN